MTDKSGIPSGVLKLLRDYKSGSLDETAILARLNATLFEDLEHSTIDHDRARRTGAAEVIFGQGKTPEQLADAFAALTDAGSNVMATRVDDAGAAAILARKPEAEYFSAARIAQLKQNSGPRTTSSIAVVSAGTSDFAVAEEAAVTAEFLRQYRAAYQRRRGGRIA